MPEVNRYLRLLNEIDETAYGFRSRVNECTLVEYRLMAAANSDPGLHLKDLSSQRCLYPQGVGRLASGLQARGLIKIERDPTDRRGRNIVLTEDGQKLLNRCNGVLDKLLVSNS